MISRAAYTLYCREFAKEAKAVAMAESSEDPFAISPGGMGVGIMQQSQGWQTDYMPTPMGIGSGFLYGAAMSTDRRWHPSFQLACYAMFAFKHRDLSKEARWRLYHYGHLMDSDPDGYVAHVMDSWRTLGDWPDGSDTA
jgi:hypothetical protein